MKDKKLYRSQDKKIAGVCSGIADYFKIDPTIVRVLFIILLLPGGVPGPLLYIILWIVMPLEPTSGQQFTSTTNSDKL